MNRLCTPRRLALLALYVFAACGDDTASDAGMSSEDALGGMDVPSVDAAEDTTTTDASAADASMADAARDGNTADAGPEGVGVFIAVGAAGRRMVSCDDGRTWGLDTSFEVEGDPLVCGEVHEFECYSETSSCRFVNRDGECETRADCDCDHHPGSGLGVAFGRENAVATFGWGPPGKVLRTDDGAEWGAVDEGHTFAGVAYGSGAYVLASRRPFVSIDEGATFAEGGTADFSAGGNTIYNARVVGYAKTGPGADEGSFMMFGSDGDRRDMQLSDDRGQTWVRPTTFPDECIPIRGGLGGVMGSSDSPRQVLVGHTISCWSRSGGQEWIANAFPPELLAEGDRISAVVVDGEEVFAWRRGGGMLHSTDGENFRLAGETDLFLGVVARSSDGTFVAVNGGWNRWYDDQRFYRSEDGIVWEELGPAAASRGHRIQSIAHGYLRSCPLD